MKKWEKEHELSPPCDFRENEPRRVEQEGPVVRAPNEPITQEERGRENEPPQAKSAAVRAQNEPTARRGREDEPPKKDPEGQEEKGSPGFPKVQTNAGLLKDRRRNSERSAKPQEMFVVVLGSCKGMLWRNLYQVYKGGIVV